MNLHYYNCISLTSINVSTFNTSNVLDMSEMFYDCNSLKIIDISNFDMIECDFFNDMFFNIDNISYINIKNLQNDKIINNSFNQEKLFYVCESIFIIQNKYAYNCCDYNFETNQCDYIPLTDIITDLIDESTIINNFKYSNNW